jgi:indole-3-glycerol phosphate synthase
LTEEDRFKGSLDDLRVVKSSVQIPVLRKDFIFDEYQVYEAAEAGADALLLIVAALDDVQLAQLRSITEETLGMDALVEVHTAGEVERALKAGARIIGVNNRDLRTFNVSLETSFLLISSFPPEILAVTESGLRSHDDLVRLERAGFKGFLVGENLMRAPEPGDALRTLLGNSATTFQTRP